MLLINVTLFFFNETMTHTKSLHRVKNANKKNRVKV